MTEPGKAQQPNPLRCETCDNKKDYSAFPFSEPCPLSDYNLLNPHDIMFITEKIGCASHTSAIQQRIEQAIKELKEADETSDFYECGVHVKEAIALLQAGKP